MKWVNGDPFKPTYLPPELQKVWQKHHDEMERCWVEWMDGSMRHETLYRKHEAVCDALESIGARAKEHDELEKLKGRVRALPSDCGYYEMREAVNALKSDMMSGAL